MINYDFHSGSGIDYKGRPFLQKFLEELSPYYEIVIFSNFNNSNVNRDKIRINILKNFSILKFYKLHKIIN